MLKAYLQEFHTQGGQELEADVRYHKRTSCPGKMWEPKVHVSGPCEDEDVVG